MSNLTSTDPGGDSTYDQYTSQSTSLASSTSPPKSQGQLGGESAPDDQQTDPAAEERGQRTAENIRYGQGISEGGMGGMTAGQEGSGADEVPAQEGGGTGREQQGYGGEGESSGDVGA